ncbi:hypothetical protein [Deinococcus radiophilus]|uniref:Uncharacterized protein n=1 Tax=Deinococcus radiophilus TaxID=32062 RepID=A0A431VM70_9DEIO|nr:hypothetical protein [Deinococcus radiophilus]RTR22845.1 hypothetical protein EJ104_12665 [Deinococcus radiophilus]UFA50541.1 hypothetical protein LMT64_01075 [Deinococcus radiophilus]
MQEKDRVGQDVEQGENSAAEPQNTQSREMEGEGMSSSYSGMGNLTEEEGEHMAEGAEQSEDGQP